MEKKLKYQSIAISGKPGVGRTTLLNNLKKVLAPLGWKFFSGGEWSRQYAIEYGLHDPNDQKHHLATVYDEKIDYQIDIAPREKLETEEKYVVESWIAGFNMRGLPQVLKILLICDDALRVDRIVNRDMVTVEEAKEYIKNREKANLKKWAKLYQVSKTDFWDPKYYDLVINTYSHAPTETLDIVLQALGYYKNNHG
ncbi:cytidylate kinase family protein [Candidatus Gottesmanbacteria bacterium]|nr:cytidylate kinase family protein [Candidatus Gottesmanbacteria bacterium]